MKKIPLLIAILSLILGCSVQKIDDFPVLKGPYLGQKPPENIPEIFSPRILSKLEFMDIPVFVRNGNVLMFIGKYNEENGVFVMERNNSTWSEPRKILSSNQYDYRHLFLTLNKKRLFFTSRRLIKTNGMQREELKIWVVENDIFGRLKSDKLEFPVNTDQHEFYSTVTQDGTLYFTRSPLDEKVYGDIYCSGLENGQYAKVVKLSERINTKYVEADPFIAPDESYIIFLSDRPGGLGKNDLYISYQEKDGSWTIPKSLGKEINSKANDVCPLVTPDGRFFFFASNRTGKYEIYWVDAKIIESLKPEELKKENLE